MVQRLRTIKMKRLTAITCAAIILLLKLKGFHCVDNTTNPADTLIIPPSRYPPSTSSDDSSYGGMTPSELALLSSTGLVPPERVDSIVSMINALPTSPYLLSRLPPQTICCILNELSRRPSLFNAIAPPHVVYLLDTLFALPCLMRVVPNRTICDLITAVMLSPKIVDAMQPSTVVCIMSKASPTALCAMSPAVRASLIHCALSPKALCTLTQAEISMVIDALLCADRALAGSIAPADMIELMNTTALSPSFTNNMSATRALDMLYLLSKTALAGVIPQNIFEALLASFAHSAHRLPTATIARSMCLLTCSPFPMSSADPDTVALLLAAWSSPGVLSAVQPDVVARLLFDLLHMATVTVDAVIALVYGVSCTSPSLMCNVSTCVRSAYAIRLTSSEVTTTLSIETIVKLINIMCKNQCFMTELTVSSMHLTLTMVATNGTLLKTIPPSDIVNLLDAVVGTGCGLRGISHEIIQKLLSFLNSASSLRALDSVHLSKLLSCIGRSSFMMSALSGTQLVNVLETLISVSGAPQAIPNSVYMNIMMQLMTTPHMMSETPFAMILGLLKQIQSHTSDCMFYEIPPCTIIGFTDLLGANNDSIIASLSPTDLTALVGFLTNARCFLAQLSVETMSALLKAISTSSLVVPLEVKIKLIFAIHQQLPTVLCSLPPESIGNICKSFGSFDVLQGGLSTACLGELLTTISACPCLLSAFDYQTIHDFLEYLSTSQSVLKDLEPCDVANLVISISENKPLITHIPVGCNVRFLRAVYTITPCSIPTTAAVALLKSLTSMELMMDGLTTTDVENLADIMAEDPALIAACSPIMLNLLTAMTNRFAGVPRECIVHLLAATHLASPGMLCDVPKKVRADLLELICTRSAVGCLLSEYLTVFMAVLSTSPCLMDAMSATALENLLGLLLTEPALMAEVLLPHTLANFCTMLVLTPSQHVDVSTIILLLSAACPKSVCDIPAMVLCTLLERLSDAKIVYELGLNIITSLLHLATTSPCVLEVLSGPTLNTIVVKASSPPLIQHLPPDILQCFIAALACSRPALESLRPTTIAHLFASIAEVRPCVLSATSPATATALLGAFGSQHAFASLPPPALDGLIGVLVKSSNLFTALPLCVLNELLQFFASTPAVLGSILSCTMLNFLAMLSSMPPLLRALSPCTLTAFIDALCTVSPTFLCAFPAPIVTSLFEAVAAGPALPALTPTTVASLVSALDKSPCLIPTLSTPLLTAFVAYLSNNPCLLSNTPKPALHTFVHNVQCPGSIPPVVFPVGCCRPCVAINRFGNVSANANSSYFSGDLHILSSGNNTNPIIIHPGNANETSTVWCFPKK